MIYVELPLSRIELGRPIPVNVFDTKGNLLIRRGQPIASAQHLELLAAHQACVSELDLQAWQRSYDRLIYSMLREGRSVEEISDTAMPAVILDIDYAVGFDVVGGWLDLHEALSAVLYQGAGARNAMQRLDGIQNRATDLLKANPDAALFALFQALGDPSVPYSAKHALLAAVVGELTAQNLQLPDLVRPVLFLAALTMNVAMAREQDALARQTTPPTPEQKKLITEHAGRSVEILRGLGAVNEDLLDIVGGHHANPDGAGLPRNQECRQVLHLADLFIARMAARATRSGLTSLLAARSIVADPDGKATRIGSAMSRALGFYPPGTYVTLANGETAVVVRRGAAANTPLVVSVLGANGLPVGQYVGRDSRDKQYAVRGPLNPDQLKLRLDGEKIERAADKTRPAA